MKLAFLHLSQILEVVLHLWALWMQPLAACLALMILLLAWLGYRLAILVGPGSLLVAHDNRSRLGHFGVQESAVECLVIRPAL